MSLADLFAETPIARTTTCKFGAWYATLPEDDRNAMTAAFKNQDYSTQHIVRILVAYGCPVADASIRKHRQGACTQCATTK